MGVLATTAQKRTAWIEWLDRCGSGQFVNQLFFGKTIGGVPDVWAQAVVALEEVHRAGGYTPRSAWSYNFRGIGGASCTCSNSRSCSLHGHGIAIDIDPALNPFIRTSTFSWDDTAYTPQQVALIEGICNTDGDQLWFWGGRWNSIKDYMHWETNVDPASTEVDWDTVRGGHMELRRTTTVDDGSTLHEGNYEAMKDAAVMSEHTQPGGVAFNDEIATFLVRFERYIVAKYGLVLGGDVYSKAEADGLFVAIGEPVKHTR